MKLVKTASGQHTVKMSKVEWQNIGKTAGWLEGDLEGKPVYVSLYETSRNYGGPEEGGWWYTSYTLDHSEEFNNLEEARAYADKLRDEIKNGGLNDEPLSSSRGLDQYPDPSGGDPMYDHSDDDIPRGFSGSARNYAVIIEDVAGEHETKETPHYE